MKKQNQQGFTLIELMIVIAIIGILASIAIPQYQVYTQRAEATGAVSGIRTAQLAIQEYYSVNGEIAALTVLKLSKYGVNGSDLADMAAANDIVSLVTITDATGVITITFDTVANGAPKDLADMGSMLLTPDVANGVITWTASTADADYDKFLPNMNN
ncbi:MAG: type IV pilus assembly protein PilA [Paraglaciecola psychrophila]|jgi:type IV pilus assembly protein PilA